MTTPIPYYDDGQMTIYHGDCRDILPTLEPVDLAAAEVPNRIGDSRPKKPGLGMSLRKALSSFRISRRPSSGEGIATDWLHPVVG